MKILRTTETEANPLTFKTESSVTLYLTTQQGESFKIEFLPEHVNILKDIIKQLHKIEKNSLLRQIEAAQAQLRRINLDSLTNDELSNLEVNNPNGFFKGDRHLIQSEPSF